MNDLTTTTGFCKIYLELLPQFETEQKCFDFLNAEIEMINGDKMFFNYVDFKINTFGNELENHFSFTKTYFDLLPYFLTQKECFEYIHVKQKERAKKPLFANFKEFYKQTFGG